MLQTAVTVESVWTLIPPTSLDANASVILVTMDPGVRTVSITHPHVCMSLLCVNLPYPSAT